MLKSPKFLVLAFMCMMAATRLPGQNCLENLNAAGKKLDAGNFTQCIELVRNCSTVEDESIKWQAYRLMSIAYLLQGNTDSARIYGENMLAINPNYTVNPLKDPKEFANLLDKIVVMPKFTLGLAVSAGSNITVPHITRGYVVSDYEKTYRIEQSTQIGTYLGFYLNPKWKIDAGLFATNKAYSISYSFSDWKINYYEKLSYLEMPLMVKYIIRPYKRFRVFVNAGAFGGRLLYAQNNLSASNTNVNDAYAINKMNSMDRRNKFNFGFCGGLGMYYKLRSGQLSFESNYFHSFRSITKTSTRYNYNDLIYNYYYVDDDIQLNNLSFNLGYNLFLNYKVYHKRRAD